MTDPPNVCISCGSTPCLENPGCRSPGLVETWPRIAKMCDRSVRWCRYMSRRPEDPLPTFKVGGVVRLHAVDLRAWSDRQGRRLSAARPTDELVELRAALQRLEEWATQLERSTPAELGGVGPFIAAELRRRVSGGRLLVDDPPALRGSATPEERARVKDWYLVQLHTPRPSESALKLIEASGEPPPRHAVLALVLEIRRLRLELADAAIAKVVG